MTPSILKAFFSLAVFIIGASLILLLVVPQDSPEFIVTLLSICVGSALLLLVALTSRFFNR